ncbi:MAG TPA: hypothetical protein VNS12_05665 [Pelagibacterium sp.]|uniref:MotE family protein n=1 Tax=Pelagibacterium sp. TaxID=1967288 RepID=UPI002BC1281E|nr:hypothetical protein [Pelagibacterium sp.]HWJ87536.1 hypothetical protein [Pelagibacterium sp.]
MRQIRLLPVVILAASALLVFKTIGIVSGGGQPVAMAQTADDAATLDGDALEAAELAAQALYDALSSGPEERQDIDTWRVGGGAGPERLDGANPTEALILQRLAERRAELDVFAGELETRLAVVEAAELRIEQRMSELSAMEAQINALVDRQDDAEAAQFAAIVAMYESMRPGDAATIFNDLDRSVLVRVGQAMSPRKLGPIMAKMVPAKAQELTVMLAETGPTGPSQVAAQDFSNLPQIIGQ